MDLKMHHCRSILPNKNPIDGLALFCGKIVEEGRSFCPEHAAIYYRIPEFRKRG